MTCFYPVAGPAKPEETTASARSRSSGKGCGLCVRAVRLGAGAVVLVVAESESGTAGVVGVGAAALTVGRINGYGRSPVGGAKCPADRAVHAGVDGNRAVAAPTPR